MHTKIMYSIISILTLVLSVSSQDMTETDLNKDIPDCAPEPVSIYRHALECPHHAVCGDEWITLRSRSNGRGCKDHRIIYNCRCPRNDTCPVGDNNHLLYGNKKHRMYLCESKCSIDMCGLATRAAEEMVQNSPEFNHYNFYRINCRCPGHNEPLDSRPGTLRRSTYYGRQRFDFQRSITYHEYRCTDIDSSRVDATCN